MHGKKITSKLCKKARTKRMNLLTNYLKDIFKKIDGANTNFCSTLSENNFDKFVAKSLHLSTQQPENLLQSEEKKRNN